jgi:hypothetical protein
LEEQGIRAPEMRPSNRLALEAAEKGQIRDEFEHDIPRRLKPEIDLMDFSGTDKSVPFQNLGFG